ncbi:MAG: hypothetical protein IIY21_16180 [Clostridiales bacterium]|nr:hypothetical protein [Clostridiales bacterium]MBQ1570101.1 hypothetical protein [Clostridiales bacterium]
MLVRASSGGGGGGVDISDIIDVQTMMIAQTARRNAIYTAGISTIFIKVGEAGTKTMTLYDSQSGGSAISSAIGTTGALVDVSNYNVVYTAGSAATVLTYVTVKS